MPMSGTIHSFVITHYPQIPSFDYPLPILLVDLDPPADARPDDATVRMIMNVKDNSSDGLDVGARVNVVEPAKEGESFHRIQTGHHVPKSHLRPLTARFSDTVGVADLFLGTPYLWGGSSRWGIDCSGLIQLAMRACGQDCPRDSDQQEAALGALLPEDAPLRRGARLRLTSFNKIAFYFAYVCR